MAGTPSDGDIPRPKVQLVVADPDVPSAVRLAKLVNAVTVMLPDLLEDPVVSARLKKLGTLGNWRALGVWLIGEHQRRQDVTEDVQPIEVAEALAGRTFKEQA